MIKLTKSLTVAVVFTLALLTASTLAEARNITINSKYLAKEETAMAYPLSNNEVCYIINIYRGSHLVEGFTFVQTAEGLIYSDDEHKYYFNNNEEYNSLVNEVLELFRYLPMLNKEQ